MQVKKMSLVKKISFFLCTFIALFLLFLSLLPSLISTDTGKEAFLSFLNKRLPGIVHIDSVSLSWSGHQRIEGFKFETNDGKIQIVCEKISSNGPLFTALFPSHSIGLVRFERPSVTLHQTLIQTPLTTPPQVQSASLLAEIPLNDMLPVVKIPFIGHLEIHEGKISILSENTSPIVFDAIEATVHANKSLAEVLIHIESHTLQNNVQGTIFIDSSFKKTDSLKRSLDSTLSLKHFPIDGADQIFSLMYPEYRSSLTEAIGPSLNLDCHVMSSEQTCKASFKAESKNLQASGDIEMQGDELILSSPSQLNLLLPPSFFQKLNIKSSFFQKISSSLSIHASLKTLRIPKTEKGILIEKAAFTGNLDIAPFQLKEGALSCSGIFSSPNLSQESLGNLEFSLKTGADSSVSRLDISAKHLLTEADSEIALSLELGKAPTSFLNSLFEFPYSDLLGDSLEGTLSIQGTESKSHIALQITSPLLQTEPGSFTFEDHKLSLFKSWQIHYLVQPQKLASFIDPKTLNLQKNTPITAVISQIELKDFSTFKDVKMDAFISSAPFVLPHFFAFSDYFIDHLSLHVKTDSLSQISLHLESPRFLLLFDGGFEKDSRTFFWKKPIQLQYVLDQKDFDQIYRRQERMLLVQKTPLHAQIESGSFSLNTPSLDQLKLTARFEGEEILLEDRAHQKPLAIKHLKGSFNLLGAKDSLDFSLSSEVFSSFGQGTLSSQGSIQQLSSPTPLVKVALTLEKFPSEIIDLFNNSELSLAPLLGSPFDLTLLIDKKKDTQFFKVQGKTPLLNLSGALTLTPQGLFLTDSKLPLKMEFLLTPQGYDLLLGKTDTPFALLENTFFTASLSKLSIPFLGSSPQLHKPDLSQLLIKAELENNQITFYHKENKKPLRLENTRISLQKKDSKTPLFLALDTLTDNSQKGALHLDAQLRKLLDEKGEFHLSQVHSDVVASFQKFPSDVLEIIFPSKKGRFSDLLGKSFDLTLKASLENTTGPIALSLSSPTSKVSLQGEIKSGILTLQEKAFAQIAVTPETSRVFLQEGLNPLSISSLSSQTPLSIELDPKGFAVPLFPFVANQLDIPNGRIGIGKVFCRNEGNLNLMLGLLKAKQASQSSDLELWFTPIDFHIRQGVIQLERTEILVSSTYDIALWGKVDVPSNRVNMVLGLTASCLKQAFNIKDLPSDYVLHIPLTGSLDHIELNKSIATSKIVALTLWQQAKSAPSSAASGLGGALVGGILNKVLSPPGNEGSTPPAKTPFPWQSIDSSRKRYP